MWRLVFPSGIDKKKASQTYINLMLFRLAYYSKSYTIFVLCASNRLVLALLLNQLSDL